MKERAKNRSWPAEVGMIGPRKVAGKFFFFSSGKYCALLNKGGGGGGGGGAQDLKIGAASRKICEKPTAVYTSGPAAMHRWKSVVMDGSAGSNPV